MRKIFISTNQILLLEEILTWQTGEGYQYYIININFEPFNPETNQIKAFVDYRTC